MFSIITASKQTQTVLLTSLNFSNYICSMRSSFFIHLQTKDLASALGKQCYVINCSPEMDYMSMGNIFKGLAASGAWGCFDEFNRLKSEVLSVCTVQFKSICDGLRANSPTVSKYKSEGACIANGAL